MDPKAGARPEYLPQPAKRVSGTRAKLLRKKLPRKALKLAAQIKSRAVRNMTTIRRRQKMPAKLYRQPVGYKRKAAFLRRGESLSALVVRMRALLAEGSGRR